jgi:hypothetical protein
VRREREIGSCLSEINTAGGGGGVRDKILGELVGKVDERE